MDKYPLTYAEKTVGELSTEREGLYTWFSVSCHPPEEGVWCAWAVGENGELRLGVLEPTGRQFGICRRFSGHQTAPLGRLCRGEIRPLGQSCGSDWTLLARPEQCFRSPWLCAQIRSSQGVMTRREGERQLLAFPWDRGRPFPLVELFCFAREGCVGRKKCLIFAFDREERPVFP